MSHRLSSPAYQRPFYIYYKNNNADVVTTGPFPFTQKVVDTSPGYFDTEKLTAPFTGFYYIDAVVRNLNRNNTLGIFVNDTEIVSCTIKASDNFFKIFSGQISLYEGDVMYIGYTSGVFQSLAQTDDHGLKILGVHL